MGNLLTLCGRGKRDDAERDCDGWMSNMWGSGKNDPNKKIVDMMGETTAGEIEAINKLPKRRISFIYRSVVPPSVPDDDEEEDDDEGDATKPTALLGDRQEEQAEEQAEEEEESDDEDVHIFFPDNYEDFGLTMAEKERLNAAKKAATPTKAVGLAFADNEEAVRKMTPRAKRNSFIGIAMAPKEAAQAGP